MEATAGGRRVEARSRMIWGMHLPELLDALAPTGDGAFTITVPDDWKQGRTVYGGLSAALAGHAARLSEADLGPLRTLQIAFIGPPQGPLRFVPTTLRRGRSVTFIGVDCLADGQVASRVILTYGQARETEIVHSRLQAPQVPDPEDCTEITIIPGTTPLFLTQMDIRLAGGSALISGGEPEFSWWTRHRDAAGVDPELAALAVGDVLPPAALAERTEFRPLSSVTWTADFADRLPPADDWYLLSTSSDHAAGGYSLQTMSCFSADRQLVSLSRQTVAIF